MRRMDRMSFIFYPSLLETPTRQLYTTPPIHRPHHCIGGSPANTTPDRIKVSLRCGRTPGSGASSPTLGAKNLPRPCQFSDRRPWSCSCCGRSWRVQWCTSLALFLMGLNEQRRTRRTRTMKNEKNEHMIERPSERASATAPPHHKNVALL